MPDHSVVCTLATKTVDIYRCKWFLSVLYIPYLPTFNTHPITKEIAQCMCCWTRPTEIISAGIRVWITVRPLASNMTVLALRWRRYGRCMRSQNRDTTT